MRKIVAIACLSVVLFKATATHGALFNASEFVLENGLHCVVVENHKAPLIKQMLWYKNGSIDEQSGKGGSAHLLEHLMFRGTKYSKDGEFNRLMEKYGVSDNAFTTHNVTSYHQFADVSKLELLLALEADRMQNLDFGEQAFDAERKIVYQERMQRVENNPASPFYERLNQILWGFSPYGRPVTGLPEEILGLTRQDVMDYYHKFYTPNNAILVLSGDIEPEQARRLVTKYFADIKPRELHAETPKAERLAQHSMLEMALPDIKSIKLSERYLLDTPHNLQDKVYDYLVLAEYLGGGSTSALYKDLVIKQKAFMNISASYNFVSRGETIFSFNIIPQQTADFNGQESLAQLQTAIKEAMTLLDEEKLAQIKRKMSAELVYVNDNPEDAAEWLGYLLSIGFSLSEAQAYEDKLNAVTIDGVRNAYAELLKAPRVSGILLPQEAIDHNQEGGRDE